jgi:hypothetical protein
MKIFDLEEEICLEIKILLRVLKSLDGISQIPILNSLFLCGISEENMNNTVGAFLSYIDLTKSNPSIEFLVNSIFPHIYPSLLSYKKDLIIVVGGKEQIECEYYSISDKRWKALPDLNEDRYKGCLIGDEKNNCIYLFGGYSQLNNCNMEFILKLNMLKMERWEEIHLKNNENLLARNFSVGIKFESSNKIYIFGGFNNDFKETDDIVEYNIKDNSVSKYNENMRKLCSFSMQGYSDLNKNHFAFYDNNNYIHTITENDFRINLILFDGSPKDKSL